jgi:Antidote-toxin recognition MazE, bacterial antitoxin
MINVKGKTNSTKNELENQKKIAPIFMSNGLSSTMIIPIELARKYGIDKPSHVTLEDTGNGILIKKLVIK